MEAAQQEMARPRDAAASRTGAGGQGHLKDIKSIDVTSHVVSVT
jgi:hypothetical protein